MIKDHYEVVIAGAGPAGLVAGLLVARAGLHVVIIDPVFINKPGNTRQDDARTIALMQGAVRLLKHLDVWSACKTSAAPLWCMRLIDKTQRFLQAPTVTFDAHELGDSPFAWNVPLNHLTHALQQACEQCENLTMLGGRIEDIETHDDKVTLRIDTAPHSISAACCVAADGRNSLCREGAGIKTTEWSYPQKAVACSFSHSLPHDDMSTEFHSTAGPCTLVPLSGNRSSLVWIEKPDDADVLFQLSDAEFCAQLEEHTEGMLGKITEVTRRGLFPIHGLTARKFAQNRVMLVGEAGHVLPPIGAQGLNLGMRDAALVAELIQDAKNSNQDIGSTEIMQTYDRRRRQDVFPRTVAVDLLNRSLIHNFAPLQGARGLGLFMLNKIGPLRREVMQRGIQPLHDVPRVMQG